MSDVNFVDVDVDGLCALAAMAWRSKTCCFCSSRARAPDHKLPHKKTMMITSVRPLGSELSKSAHTPRPPSSQLPKASKPASQQASKPASVSHSSHKGSSGYKPRGGAGRSSRADGFCNALAPLARRSTRAGHFIVLVPVLARARPLPAHTRWSAPSPPGQERAWLG